MKKINTKIPNLFVLEPTVHQDERGFFVETYRKDVFSEIGITKEFLQDNYSFSKKGVIRGLKFQFDKPTDKLVRVVHGSIFAVGVDIRPNSKTFGMWDSVELSSNNHLAFYLPFGFAFGFCALSDASVMYKLSAVHNEKGSGTILWNDPSIGITWPAESPVVSAGDQKAPTLKEWERSPSSKFFSDCT
ncbi:MAG: dTDP-4-dehydrorhamnose 3,5-epimerase [Patescibacteria group bacterium]